MWLYLIYKERGQLFGPGFTFYLGNLKNDDSTVSITNTGCIRRDNQCREQIDEVFLFFDLFPVFKGICENHTGQIDLFLFFDLFQKEHIDLVFFLTIICYINVRYVISARASGYLPAHTSHRTA